MDVLCLKCHHVQREKEREKKKDKKGQQRSRIKTELKENYFPMEKIPYAMQDDLLDWMAAGFGWVIP